MLRRWIPLVFAIAGCDEAQPASGLAPDSTDVGVQADASFEPIDAVVPVVDVGGALDASAPTPDADGVVDTGFADAGWPDAGPPPPPPDPASSGPWSVVEAYETSIQVVGTGNRLPLACRYPSRVAEPVPLVVIGHGFQIPADQYLGYAERLATFGYFACTADFRTRLAANHIENAADVIAGIDFMLEVNAVDAHPLQGRIDPLRVGVMGHSLGGKIAFIVGARDPRVGAVLGLDPVDGGMFCPEARCPDVSMWAPLTVPVAVLGETIDGTSDLQACAPTADNFRTFYEAAASPALEIEVLGANHMSFIDDLARCGLPCGFCNPATASQADVLALSRAMTVAFFERYLKGDARYDTFLTGEQAEARYGRTGRAVIRSK